MSTFLSYNGGNKNKKFKSTELHKLLLSVHHLSINEQEAFIKKAFLEWKGDNEQTDDVLMGGIRI